MRHLRRGMPDQVHRHGGGREMKKVIMGNHALSYGAMLGRSQVIAAYPITPQTQVVELLSEMCANKTLDAKFIKVESEHRSMAPGWSIWADQNDSLSERDTGWMQFYCASNQEVLDTTLQCFKVSEALSIPSMIILDAFALSHTYEVVDVPDQKVVDELLP